MQSVLLTIQGASVYTLSAFVFLAFLWSAFVFYKKSVEYHENEDVIFNAILLMGILSFVFARGWYVASNLSWFVGHWIRVFFMKEYPGMSGWGVVVGVLVAVLFLVRKTKKDLYKLLDLASLGLSAGIPIVFAAKGALVTESVVVFGLFSAELAKGLLLALWFFFLWWAEGEYRTFEWYRFRKTQARTGFVTGVFMFGFGLINLLVELLIHRNHLWSVYLGIVVVGVLVVYIRSERRVKKDFELLLKSAKGLSVNKKTFKWLKKIKK